VQVEQILFNVLFWVDNRETTVSSKLIIIRLRVCSVTNAYIVYMREIPQTKWHDDPFLIYDILFRYVERFGL